MPTILLSDRFKVWLKGLRDERAKARIAARLRSASYDNFGDTRSVGSGVFEMRIHYGPGYRIYYARRGETVYLLLKGGDKASQSRDIQDAITMLSMLDRSTP
ncbi:type II toxin-antitoxin system RelE/ParE family toxin [Methylobacterium marchantiae]|uniref:Type II toxin-antitoxin system RelE/ParE family toxin n=1 Tax=Methylobacterium marchantiae TaxID=600331 RepID=A0ABW3WZW6_9HYPH|nr:hypothetical protein AIGOOFII_2326 [Methylobacterium marchantiae]